MNRRKGDVVLTGWHKLNTVWCALCGGEHPFGGLNALSRYHGIPREELRVTLERPGLEPSEEVEAMAGANGAGPDGEVQADNAQPAERVEMKQEEAAGPNFQAVLDELAELRAMVQASVTMGQGQAQHHDPSSCESCKVVMGQQNRTAYQHGVEAGEKRVNDQLRTILHWYGAVPLAEGLNEAITAWKEAGRPSAEVQFSGVGS